MSTTGKSDLVWRPELDRRARLEDLRDRFAAAALTGLLSQNQDGHLWDFAVRAYRAADYMLEARTEK